MTSGVRSTSHFTVSKHLQMLVFCVAFHGAVLYPAVFSQYAVRDSWHFLQPDSMGFFNHMQIPLQLYFIRPLSALLLGLSSGVVSSLDDLQLLRGIALVIVVVSHYYTWIWLLRLNLSFWLSFSISILVFSLGIASIVAWAATAIFTCSLIPILLANEIIWNVPHKTRKLPIALMVVLSAILILCAFLIYPPTALFIVFFSLSSSLFASQKDWRTRFGQHAAIITTVTIAVLMVIWFARGAYHTALSGLIPIDAIALTSPYDIALETNIFELIVSLLGDILPSILNLTQTGSHFSSALTLLVISLSVFLMIINQNSLKWEARHVLRIAVIITTVSISIAHLIYNPVLPIARRLLWVPQAGVVLFVCWACRYLFKHSRLGIYVFWLFIPFCVYVIGLSAWRTRIFIDTAKQEVALVEAALLQNYTSETNIIIVIPRLLVPAYGWDASTMTQDSTLIPVMVAHLMEVNDIQDRVMPGIGFESVTERPNRREIEIAVVDPYKKNHVRLRNGDQAILDTSMLIDFSDNAFTLDQIPCENLAFVEALPDSEQHPITFGFSDSLLLDRFWETSGFPVEVLITWICPVEIEQYTLTTRYNAGARMPKSWTLELGRTEEIYELVDDVRDQVSWDATPSRTYALGAKQTTQHARITFEEGNDPHILRVYDLVIE